MKVEAVILAAGFSSRAGVNKMLLPAGNRSILERCVDTFLPVCSRIIVVGGHRINELHLHVNYHSKVQIVENKAFEAGMFSSVLVGISYFEGDYCFVTPGDYPLILTATCESLLKVADHAVIPTYRGQKGHPILLSAATIDKLHKSTGHHRLKDFLKECDYTLVEVPDPGIRLDVDSLDDYERILYELNYRSKNAGHLCGDYEA
ncbi:MAG: nucleotidyltransferase family protein [Candidatus Saccharibacteria bacterium]